MALQKYEINFSKLTETEKSALTSLLNTIAFSGLAWTSDFKSACFFIDEDFDTSRICIPDCCKLRTLSHQE